MANRSDKAWLMPMLRPLKGAYREVAAMSLFVMTSLI